VAGQPAEGVDAPAGGDRAGAVGLAESRRIGMPGDEPISHHMTASNTDHGPLRSPAGPAGAAEQLVG
jgi:hypothetical protein